MMAQQMFMKTNHKSGLFYLEILQIPVQNYHFSKVCSYYILFILTFKTIYFCSINIDLLSF